MKCLGHIATLLVRFTLANKGALPYGWAPRILVQCGVPFTEIWDVFHEMYESQVSRCQNPSTST
jgi:nuclear pore complex protein Nup155